MKKRVFVTDDDPGVQDILQIIFQRAGYEITIFNNGKALLAVEDDYPDIYILDKQLSGMDGLDICRTLKRDERTKHIPVIMISATPSLGRLAKEAGADNYIEKPFRKADLLDMVGSYLGKPTAVSPEIT